MKNILLSLILLLSLYACSQVNEFNLSGTWTGTVNNEPNLQNYFKLKLTMVDSCPIYYKVEQYEDRHDKNGEIAHEGIYTYYFMQSGSVLLRDVIRGESGGSGDHLKLVFKNNSLIGARVGKWSGNEAVFLNSKTNHNIHTGCNKNINEDLPCYEIKKPGITDTVFIEKPSILILSIEDDAIEDSDVVTIFLNKKQILKNVVLYSSSAYSMPVKINDDALITWCACNQGNYGDNTGSISLSTLAGVKRSFQIHLKTNENHSILVRVIPNYKPEQVIK